MPPKNLEPPVFQQTAGKMNDQNFNIMRFDLPKEQSSIIKVIGVGGGGSNAVNYMYEQGIKGVDFVVCNTDAQALDASPVPFKVQLGSTLTEGRGAGSKPEVGRNAAVENLEDVKSILGNNTTMVFVTAGMGGGTGTGAAPIIAQAAKEMGILTVGIVTVPFNFEGRRRSQQAEEGLQEMRDAVDTLLVIKNDKLRELFGNLPLKQAFGYADEILCTAAKGIAEVITLTGEINVDMNDVNTVMRDSGVAIMGSGQAAGENRAMVAVQEALESPLLNDNDITGANFVLLNITFGDAEVLMDEITEITDYIQGCAGQNAEVIWGYGRDESLEDKLCVTVIATGFQSNRVDAGLPRVPEARQVFKLDEQEAKELTQRVDKPTSDSQGYVPPVEQAPEPFLVPNSPLATNDEAPVDEPSETSEWEVKLVNSEHAPTETSDTEISDVDTPATPVEEIRQERLLFHEEPIEEAPKKPIFRNLDGEIVDKYEMMKQEPSDQLKIEVTSPKEPASAAHQPYDREEAARKNRERENQLRELTGKLRTPNGLASLENQPAYMRRNIQLDDTPKSSDDSVSRFTLSEEEDIDGTKRAQLREDNSFLHKNVD